MNIPAYTSPTLCIGRTFDAENSTASIDIFAADIPTKQINVNKFSFKYSVVKNSKDVNDLLDVSGELSLKIKANLLKVEGAGQYVNEAKKEEGTTTLLAVMKCTTVTETINEQVEPTDSTVGIGTHYVRSVTYGAELVARLKFRTSSTDEKEDIKGRAEGDLSPQAVKVGLKAALHKLTSECKSVSDLQVDYYSTGLPDKLPITIEELTGLIESFPSRMKDINNGKGIPMTFELLPVTNIIPTARAYLQDRVKAYDLEEMENCFDDVRSALHLANEFLKSMNKEHDDVKEFISETRKVEKVFRKAISTLGRSEEKEQVENSQKAYEGALGGLCLEEKFVQHWKKMLSAKIGRIRMEGHLEEALSSAQSLSDVGLEAAGQQVTEDLRELQGMEMAIAMTVGDTVRSFRQAADTLDEVWKAANKGHAAGTAISIVGGLLTLGGGIATIMSAGAASPLLLLGMGAGFSGGGINVGTNYIEAALNSKHIQRAENDWKKTLDCINKAKSTLQSLLDSRESTRLMFELLEKRHLKLEFLRRFTPSLLIGSTALQQSAGKTGAQAVAKAGTQAADDVAQAVAKAATQATDDVAQAATKASAQAADDIAQAGVKAGAKAGKVAGGVIIGVSAVFLVWDVFDLHFTIRDLLNEKGSDAAKFLRAKADELEKICSCR